MRKKFSSGANAREPAATSAAHAGARKHIVVTVPEVPQEQIDELARAGVHSPNPHVLEFFERLPKEQLHELVHAEIHRILMEAARKQEAGAAEQS